MSETMFTVVTPAYRSGRTIGRAMLSISRQTEQDWRHVIVDDCSGDDTPEVARQMAGDDPRITVISRDENGGTSAARNTALKEVATPFTIFLDADDELEPVYMEHMLDAISRYPEHSIFSCNATCLTEGGDSYPWFDSSISSTPHELRLQDMLTGNGIFIASTVKTSALLDVGGFDEDVYTCEDYDMWLRLIEAGYRHRYVPESLAIYHSHSQAASTQRARQYRVTSDLIRAVLARNPELPSGRGRSAIKAALRYEAMAELDDRFETDRLDGSRSEALATLRAYEGRRKRVLGAMAALASPGWYFRTMARRRKEQLDVRYGRDEEA